MLKKISEYCTKILVERGIIQETKARIYHYGFELFWSTFFCVICILLIGGILGWLPETISFLLYFMPIRTFAGGYHAQSYRNCFLLTNLIAVSCIAVSKIMNVLAVSKLPIVIGAWILLVYIWAEAPVRFKKHPLKAEIIKKCRSYAHRVILLEAIIFGWMYISNCNIVYITAVTTYVVAVMLYIAVRKEENV
ncbi:MAG: accessory gene regulator B family protein [Monoglobales bacterium]